MLANNPRQDLFRFSLPSTFFDTSVIDKYNKLLTQYDQTFDNIESVINESIQNVTFPGVEFTPIEQIQQRDKYSASEEYFRSNENIQKVLQKTITISFRHISGYLTYFCLLEHYFKYYSFETTKRHLGTFALQLLDVYGNVVYTLNLKRVLFTGMTDLTLSYANVDRSFVTFDTTFYYSEFDTIFSIPELNLKES